MVARPSDEINHYNRDGNEISMRNYKDEEVKRSWKVAATGVALVAGAVLLAGCGTGQQWRDLEGQPQTEPDKVRLITNINGYPNVVALCIEGVGFVTTTRDYTSLQESPGLTAGWCAE
jgi:hypothetical protein